MGGDGVEKKSETDLTTTIHLGAQSSDQEQSQEPIVENLSLLSDEERAIVSELSEEDAMLIVHRGPGKGARFLISDVTSVGRSPESEVFLDDVTVSRKHALISIQPDGAFRIADLASLNGTYLNSKAVVDATLTTGDEIQIGKFHMLFFGGKK